MNKTLRRKLDWHVIIWYRSRSGRCTRVDQVICLKVIECWWLRFEAILILLMIVILLLVHRLFYYEIMSCNIMKIGQMDELLSECPNIAASKALKTMSPC